MDSVAANRVHLKEISRIEKIAYKKTGARPAATSLLSYELTIRRINNANSIGPTFGYHVLSSKPKIMIIMATPS